MELADLELMTEFVVESLEGLSNVENQMLAIEATGENIDTDLVNSVFRTMHSIKGASGFLGLDRIGTLAHGLEEVLNNLRNREIIPTSELVTSVLSAADFMKGLIDSVETSNDADVAPFVESLKKFRPDASEPTPPMPEPVAVPEVPTAPVPEVAAEVPEVAAEVPEVAAEVSEKMTDMNREFLIECHENLDQMESDLVSISQNGSSDALLRNLFRTMHTIKGGAGFLGFNNLERFAHAAENVLSELRDGKRKFTAELESVLLGAVDKCREGLRLVETTHSDATFCAEPVAAELVRILQPAEEPSHRPQTALPLSSAAKAIPQAEPSPARPTTIEATSQPAPACSANEAASSEKNQASIGDTTIRVDVALLDKLMTRVGELVLARNQILQCTNNRDDAVFLGAAQRLNLITTELQESVMKTRMQPIGNVWAKFPRVVRDLSAQLGKQIRIEMEGKETELDKTIIEAIKDPLTHLVRNSVDHGIETPESRVAAGKPAEGVLLLRAFHEGGQVNIEITDDGAGLNLDRIRKKAIERGLVSADAAARMSDRETSQLILLPGFSTAERVTSVSGRGVGMDVVKTNIERIGGTLELQSRPGQGMTLNIKIPLTLAIIPALVVTNSGDQYAIPQVSLVELVRLDAEQAVKCIEHVHNAPVYRLRGKLLPLVKLSQALGTTASESDALTAVPTTPSDQSMNIDFVLARGKHLAWKGRLRDFLDGKQSMILSEAASHRDCSLGKWLYAEGMREFGHLSGVKQLEQLHAEMHSAVGKVIRHKEQGDLQGAEKFLVEVDTLSQQVVALRDDLARTARGADALNIVVLRANNQEFGLIVDKVNDTEEIVVKPLGRQLKGIAEYAGATIMGDGNVALILDVMGLAVAAGLATENRDGRVNNAAAAANRNETAAQTLLVVDLGDTRRYALPTSMVSRLEKVSLDALELADGREVIQYRGNILPLVRLTDVFGSGTAGPTDAQELQVVVYSDDRRTCGFIVNRIVDIVEMDVRLRRDTVANDNLLGTLVIHDHVTDVPDLSCIAERYCSENFQSAYENQVGA